MSHVRVIPLSKCYFGSKKVIERELGEMDGWMWCCFLGTGTGTSKSRGR